MLQNKHLVPHIGFDTAENEPSKVCQFTFSKKIRELHERGRRCGAAVRHQRRQCRIPAAAFDHRRAKKAEGERSFKWTSIKSLNISRHKPILVVDRYRKLKGGYENQSNILLPSIGVLIKRGHTCSNMLQKPRVEVVNQV